MDCQYITIDIIILFYKKVSLILGGGGGCEEVSLIVGVILVYVILSGKK